jgi:hypothetical protein
MAEIQAFVDRLLSGPPGPRNSIQMEVDTDGDIVGLFEVFLTIMTSLLKAWYPTPISFSRVRDNDWDKLREYFASFGIRFHLSKEEIPQVLRINNRAYETKQQLEEMQFQLTAEDTLFTVRFSFLA